MLGDCVNSCLNADLIILALPLLIIQVECILVLDLVSFSLPPVYGNWFALRILTAFAIHLKCSLVQQLN